MNPVIRYVTTKDGVRLACSELGTGPPLLLVRGWISHLELMWADPAFRRYFEAIAKHFRVIRFDMRGNGLSQRAIPPISLEAMLADIEQVIDEVVGDEPIVLYGQCFGGPAAITYAARHPERVSSLILDGTYADGPQITSKRRQERIVNTLRELPEAGLLLLSHYTQPRASSTRFGDVSQDDDKILPETAADLYRFGFEIDVREHLKDIKAPVLVLHRRDTRAVTLRLGRDLAEGIDGARLVTLDGVAHNSWDEAPEVALAALGEFLGVQFEIETPTEATNATRGLRTILFTDIEHSTDITDALGDDRGQDIRREHDTIVRDALRTFRGSEVKHTGDGIMATFPSTMDALECAIAIERACAARNQQDGPALKVRIGLNAGEPIEESGDLFGTAVIMASRIMAQAAGGEILASNVIRELCAGKGFLFADRGLTGLKGFDEPVHVYEVKWD